MKTERLVYGRLYETALYEEPKAIYLGSKLTRKKPRHLIVLRRNGSLFPVTFANYSLDEGKIMFTRKSHLGFPCLRGPEAEYVTKLLEERATN